MVHRAIIVIFFEISKFADENLTLGRKVQVEKALTEGMRE